MKRAGIALIFSFFFALLPGITLWILFGHDFKIISLPFWEVIVFESSYLAFVLLTTIIFIAVKWNSVEQLTYNVTITTTMIAVALTGELPGVWRILIIGVVMVVFGISMVWLVSYLAFKYGLRMISEFGSLEKHRDKSERDEELVDKKETPSSTQLPNEKDGYIEV